MTQMGQVIIYPVSADVLRMVDVSLEQIKKA